MRYTFAFLISLVFLTGCSSSKRLSNEFRDASSYEKAIVVDGISEEYEYVRNHCKGCQFQSQALVFENKKPYDILTVMLPDGAKKKYFFDISKFYGKGF